MNAFVWVTFDESIRPDGDNIDTFARIDLSHKVCAYPSMLQAKTVLMDATSYKACVQAAESSLEEMH
jgi:hypothetical protein